MGFTKPEDVANAALQIVGSPRITAFTDNSKQASEINFRYPGIRRAELRRSVWRFATRRTTLRAVDANTKRFVAPQWTDGSAYVVGSIVQDSDGIYWIAYVQNFAVTAINKPGLYIAGNPQPWQQYFGPLYGTIWSNAISYFAGEVVYQSGSWYCSIQNSNLNHAVNLTAWWTPLAVTVDLPAFWPIAAGPGVTVSGLAQNIYPLPNGFLRVTYAGVKTASTATNVVSGGLQFNDWQLESDYLISASAGPLQMRFVADISDVSSMDSMFIEGLALRLAYTVCETLTQSQAKAQQIGTAYGRFIAEARAINLIETGSDEPEEDKLSDSQNAANVSTGARAAPPQPAGGR